MTNSWKPYGRQHMDLPINMKFYSEQCAKATLTREKLLKNCNVTLETELG